MKRGFSYWCVPAGVRDYSKDLLARISSGSVLKDNGQFRQIHKGERCFIILAGPSIKNQNLKKLSGEYSISVSNTFVHPDFQVIAPRYHCIPDVGLHDFSQEVTVKWFEEMNNKLGNARVFMSTGDKSTVEKNNCFSGRGLSYFTFGSSWDLLNRSRLDLKRPIPHPQSVSILALYIAIYMGFSKIYLLGANHDWIMHTGKSAHFYSEKENALTRKEGYSEWRINDLENDFKAYHGLWKQYKCLRAIANESQIEIFNATEGGMLDVFPNVKLDDLFSS